jgi:hypothetical protein
MLLQPPFSWARYGGQLLVGMVWGSWFVAAVPEEDILPGINLTGLRLLMPAVCAMGSWFLYNIKFRDAEEKFFSSRDRRLRPVFLKYSFCSGTWLVGNIGHEQGNLKPPLIASYAVYILYGMSDKSVTTCTLSAASTFNHWSKQWRRTPRKKLSFWR